MSYLQNRLLEIAQPLQQQIALVADTTNVPLTTDPLAEVKPLPPPVDARIIQATTPLQQAIAQQAAIIDQQSQVIQQQQAILAAVPKMLSDALALNNTEFVTPAVQAAYQAIVGGTSVQGLYTLQEVMQHIVSDETGTAQLLAAQNVDRGRFAALEPAVAQLSTDLTSLTGTVGGKASTADLQALTTTVASKALASDLTTTNNNVAANTAAIAQRATITALNTLQGTVAQNTTDLTTKASATALNTQTGRIDGLLTTTVPALQADTASRLLRSGDTATGLIKGPDATAKTAYPTFQQTFGGVNSPRRTIQNITTGTTAMVALTDTTGQNRSILPIGIQFLLTGSLNLLSSVTVKLGTTSGGAELYTKTYSLLTGLLGKVTTIDQPTSATPLPAGTILYATITGGGQWTCFFDAVFLPTAS